MTISNTTAAVPIAIANLEFPMRCHREANSVIQRLKTLVPVTPAIMPALITTTSPAPYVHRQQGINHIAVIAWQLAIAGYKSQCPE